MKFSNRIKIFEEAYKRSYDELVTQVELLKGFEVSLYFLQREDWRFFWNGVIETDKEREECIKQFSKDKAAKMDAISDIECKLKSLQEIIDRIKNEE